jgi:NDP-sugar pyrophosphorylase family protein
MKAMVFSAGKGTRLYPLTTAKPKALVEVNGIPMIKLTLLRLKMSGFSDIIINLHHFPDQIISYLEKHHNFGLNITFSDESSVLLDTGGGLKKASWFFEDQPFLVHNVDVVSGIDLSAMMRSHIASGALASLAVSKRLTSRYLLFDKAMRLCGWEDTSTGEKIMARETETPEQYAFSGIHAVSGMIPGLITEKGAFSVVEMYLRMARDHEIRAYVHEADTWFDLGKVENIKRAEECFNFHKYISA